MTNVFAGFLPIADSTYFAITAPANLTDGTSAATYISDGVANPPVGPSTYHAYWTMDLGDDAHITSILLSYLGGSSGALSIDASANGASWTQVVSAATIVADSVPSGGGLLATVTINETYRYWRLNWTITFGSAGLQFFSGVSVFELSSVGTLLVPPPGVIVDFEDDGFGIADDDDLTADIMDWTITRGAGAEITSGANPGSAVFHVRRKERDGKYNPRNASSPLYPNLRDGLRVHIAVNNDGTLTAAGTVKGLFAGRVTDITVLPDSGPDDAVVTEFACEDPLAWYQRTPVHIADSRTRSHRELRLAILAAIGETRYVLDSEIGTMPLSSADGDALSVLGQINAANGTRHFAKPADRATDWYHYTTYNRQHRLSGAIDATIDAGVEHANDTSGWRLSADTVINQQTATVVPIDFPLGRQAVWISEQLPITISDTTVIWANFTDYVDGALLSQVHTGTCATAIESFGRSAKITLTPTGTATFSDLQVFGRPVIRGPSQAVVIDDTTSQTAPRGVRAGSEISGDYVGVLAMARGIAGHMVWRYGSPQLRPTLTVTNWFPEQFELDLFDVIEFSSGNLGSDSILYEIVGLTHTGIIASPTVVYHTVVYVLQECRVQTDPGWFILDSSELDGPDILAY